MSDPASCADLVAAPWFARLTTHLHTLGPRAVSEFIAEIMVAAPEQDREWIASRLHAYSRLRPGQVPDMPAPFLRVIDGGGNG